MRHRTCWCGDFGDLGCSRKQLLGIAVFGRTQHVISTATFHHPAFVHHHHVFGHVSDHTQIMGDQYNGHPGVRLKGVDQSQNLRLGGHVKCGCWFIRDQQIGFRDHRHRDHRALAHAA